MSVVSFPARTYTAKLFRVPVSGHDFLISGTLDGYLDFALPNAGTYQLSIAEARSLVAALNGAVCDITENCLYDRDALLALHKDDTE